MKCFKYITQNLICTTKSKLQNYFFHLMSFRCAVFFVCS